MSGAAGAGAASGGAAMGAGVGTGAGTSNASSSSGGESSSSSISADIANLIGLTTKAKSAKSATTKQSKSAEQSNVAEQSETPEVETSDVESEVEDVETGEEAEESEETGEEEPTESESDSEVETPATESNEPTEREDALLDEIRAMREELKSLRAERNGEEQPAEEPLVDLVGEHYGDFVSSPEGLNKFANVVLNSAVQATIQKMQPIITSEATRISTIFEYNRMFYANNKDLVGKEQTVQDVFKEMTTKNPRISVQDLFTKGAAEARRRLGIGATQAVATPTRPAGFSKPTGGGRAPAKTVTKTGDQKSEIADLLGLK